MLRFVRARLGYANVVATLALFVALGGTALAAVVVSDNSQIAPNTIYGANAPAGKNDNVVDGSLGTSDLGPASVTNPKLADGAVGAAKLAGGSVVAGKLGNTAVGTSNLVAKAVTVPKLGDDVIETIEAQKGGAVQFSGTRPIDDNTAVNVTAGLVTSIQCASATSAGIDLTSIAGAPTDVSGTWSHESSLEPLNRENSFGFDGFGFVVNLDVIARNRSVGKFVRLDVHVSAAATGCVYWGWALPAA